MLWTRPVVYLQWGQGSSLHELHDQAELHWRCRRRRVAFKNPVDVDHIRAASFTHYVDFMQQRGALSVNNIPGELFYESWFSFKGLFDHLPVIVMKKFDCHIAAPLTVPGFVNLSKPTRTNHLPVVQSRVCNLHRRQTAEQSHSSLESKAQTALRWRF